MDSIINTAKSWLTDFFDDEVQVEIQNLMANDPEELKDRFYNNPDVKNQLITTRKVKV